MHAAPNLPRLLPKKALAWSEAAVDNASGNGPFLGLWAPEGVTVAIGIGQTPDVELEVDAMRRDGVGLVRRQSGGGAVLLYEGVLCWEAWAALDEIDARSEDGSGIRSTYRVLCEPVLKGLASLGIPAFHAGICDVSYARDGETPRKLAGTAQLRRKDRALVHGSLLVCPDLDLLAKYLKFPSDQPEYRRGRSHRDFCVSVSELVENSGKGGDGVFGRAVRAVREAALSGGWTFCPPAAVPETSREAALEQEKYGSDAWNWDRIRPTFNEERS